MKSVLIGILICCMTVLSFGQQQEHYSMYMQNNYLVNPAEGGTDDFVDFKLGYRTQWVDFGNNNTGGPKTMFVSGHTPINKRIAEFDDITPTPFHGAGGAIILDEIGPFKIITAKASYAYHLPVSNKLTLSIGAFAGVKQYQIEGDELRFSSDNSAVDPIAASFQTAYSPDVSLGLWGYSKTYYFGISAFQLINSKVDLYKDFDQAESQLANHYWLTGGYKIHVTDEWFVVPSVVAKYVQDAPFTFDLNAKIRYQDQYWAGVSYRREDALVLSLGTTLMNKFDVGYSYDITRTDIKDYSAGSHEIIIGYRMPLTEHEPPPAQFW